MERLDGRSRLSWDYRSRFHDLLPLLGHLPEAYRNLVCRQISYLELRLSMMQAQELLTGTPEPEAILRAMRELRAWYSFIRLHPGGWEYQDYSGIVALRRRSRQREASEGRE